MRALYTPLLSVLLICFAFLPHAKAESFTLHYAMYAGGFQAMNIQTDFNFSKTAYNAKMAAKPHGVLGQFLPWAGEYKVNGILTHNTLTPLSHITLSQWREDKDSYDMRFSNQKLVSVIKLEEEKGKRTQTIMTPDLALHQGTIDVMTAAIKPMRLLDAGQNCTTSSLVFDGKRRFRLSFTDKGNETLQSTRYNIFSGVTRVCEIEMTPLLGYKGKSRGYYKIQEDARKKGQLPRVWMGQAWQNGPFVPVKMMVKSDFGAVLVHLQKVTRSTP